MPVPRLAKANPVERESAYLWMDSLLTFGRIAPSPFILCASANLGSFVVSSVCPRARVLNPFPLQCHRRRRRHSSRTLFVPFCRGGGGGARSGAHPLANNARVLAACWMLPFLLLLFSLSFLSSFVRVLYIKDRFSNSLSFFFFKMVLKQSCN